MSGKKETPETRCATCPAFELRNVGQGECRLNPPHFLQLPDGRTGRIFTPVGSDDWCARHPVRARRMERGTLSV